MTSQGETKSTMNCKSTMTSIVGRKIGRALSRESKGSPGPFLAINPSTTNLGGRLLCGFGFGLGPQPGRNAQSELTHLRRQLAGPRAG